MRGLHKVSFPQLVNHLLHEATVYVIRVLMSHNACTSGTSRVLTIASLQWLKMEALIPANIDCDLQSDKVFECTEHSAYQNSLSAVPGLWPHTQLDGQPHF